MRKLELKRWLCAGCAAGAVLAAAAPAAASGFATTGVTVEGLGRANSGEAADTGAGALWWNPAAIARSGREVSLGLTYRAPSLDLVDAGSTVTRPIPPAGLTTPAGGAAPSDVGESFTTPYAALALPLGERFALGLSVARPFFTRNELGAGSWTRYDTIRNQISITDVQLTGAMQVTEWLDVGVGVSGQYNDSYLDSAYPNLNPAAADGHSSLKGDGWNYGWTAGAQARFEGLTVGLSYRSAVEQEIDGSLTLSGLLPPVDSANFTAPAKTTFTTRSTLTLAARWAVTPQLTLNGQVVRSGWEEYDEITVQFAGQAAVIAQDFRNTTSVALGADYALSQVWTVRGGVQFDPTPTPDDLREPGVYDADRWIFALGATAALSEAVSVHGALAYSRFDEAGIVDHNVFFGGTPAQTAADLRGRFEGDELNVAVGVDFRF